MAGLRRVVICSHCECLCFVILDTIPQELFDILQHTIQEADDVSDDEDEDEDEEGAFYSD